MAAVCMLPTATTTHLDVAKLAKQRPQVLRLHTHTHKGGDSSSQCVSNRSVFWCVASSPSPLALPLYSASTWQHGRTWVFQGMFPTYLQHKCNKRVSGRPRNHAWEACERNRGKFACAAKGCMQACVGRYTCTSRLMSVRTARLEPCRLRKSRVDTAISCLTGELSETVAAGGKP